MKVIDNYIHILNEYLKEVRALDKKSTIQKIEVIDGALKIDYVQSEVRNEFDGGNSAAELSEIIKYYEMSMEECVAVRYFMIDFPKLSFYMRRSVGVKIKDVFQLLSVAVERNYQIYLNDPNKIILDFNALKKIDFKNITHKEITKIFGNSEAFKRFFDGGELNETEIAKKNEIIEHLNEFIVDVKEFSSNNEKFYKNFVLKFPNVTLEDIYNGLVCLNKLGVLGDVLEDLEDYFLNVFKSNLGRSTELYDLNSEKQYIEVFFDDKDERKRIFARMQEHNSNIQKKRDLERRDAKKESKPIYLKSDGMPCLTEQEVRKLKKYIKQFFDLYKVEVVKVPNYQEFLECICVLEKLEESEMAIWRFIEFNFAEIIKHDNYVVNYDELITLVSYFIKYKIGRNKIDELIIKYKDLKEVSSDLVECARQLLDEISLYDENLFDDISSLLGMLDNVDDEDYESVVELLEECLIRCSKYDWKTDYEYSLGLKKIGG